MSERTIEIPELLYHIREVRPQSLLDVGCHNTGFYAKHIKQLVMKYYTGIDILPNGDEVFYLNTRIQRDFLAIGYPVIPFEYVSCISTIEHIAINELSFYNDRTQ